MSAAHGVDQVPGTACGAADSCFGPSVPNAPNGSTYEFTDVTTVNGLVTGYRQHFPANTRDSAVRTQVMRLLPKDSDVGDFHFDEHGGSCGMFDVKSHELGKLLAQKKVGDRKGTIGIVLSSTDGIGDVIYEEDNVQTATLSLAPTDPSHSCRQTTGMRTGSS